MAGALDTPDDGSGDNLDPSMLDPAGPDTSSLSSDATNALVAKYPDAAAIRSGYDAAISRLKAQRSGLSTREKLATLLIGFGAPTRSGSWREGVSNAAQSLFEQQAGARKTDETRQALIAKYQADESSKLTTAATALARGRDAQAKAAQGVISVAPPMYPGGQPLATRKWFDAQGNAHVTNVNVDPAAPAAGAPTPPATSGAPAAPFPVQEMTGQQLKDKYGLNGYDATGRFQIQTAGADAGKVTEIATDPLAKYNGATGSALLEMLPPDDRAEVQSLYDGRIVAPTAGGRAKEGQRLLALTAAAYPDFDASIAKARFKTRQDFTPGGKAGQNIISYGTTIGHLGQLDTAVDKLGNVPNIGFLTAPVNATKNAISGGSSNPNINNFNIAKTAAINEMERAFKGTGGTLTELKEWEKSINDAQSPEALHGAIQTGASLLASRMDTLVKPYNDTLGERRSFLSWMPPKAQATFMKLNPDYTLTDDDKQYLAQQEAAKRQRAQGTLSLPAKAATAAPSAIVTAVPPRLLAQYQQVPPANRAVAKARLKAAGYDISGLP